MKLPRFLWFVPVLVAFLVLPVQGQGVTRAVPDPIGSVIAGVQVTVVQKMVPLKFTGTWWFVAEGEPEPCEEFGTDGYRMVIPRFSESEGVGTLMGRFRAVNVTQCIGVGVDGSLDLLSHTVWMTAANGDQLFAHGSVKEEPPLAVYRDGGSFQLGPVLLVGGTGRFLNAEGWFFLTGDYSFEGVGGNCVAEGEISTVGSGKRAR